MAIPSLTTSTKSTQILDDSLKPQTAPFPLVCKNEKITKKFLETIVYKESQNLEFQNCTIPKTLWEVVVASKEKEKYDPDLAKKSHISNALSEELAALGPRTFIPVFKKPEKTKAEIMRELEAQIAYAKNLKTCAHERILPPIRDFLENTCSDSTNSVLRQAGKLNETARNKLETLKQQICTCTAAVDQAIYQYHQRGNHINLLLDEITVANRDFYAVLLNGTGKNCAEECDNVAMIRAKGADGGISMAAIWIPELADK